MLLYRYLFYSYFVVFILNVFMTYFTINVVFVMPQVNYLGYLTIHNFWVLLHSLYHILIVDVNYSLMLYYQVINIIYYLYRWSKFCMNYTKFKYYYVYERNTVFKKQNYFLIQKKKCTANKTFPHKQSTYNLFIFILYRFNRC